MKTQWKTCRIHRDRYKSLRVVVVNILIMIDGNIKLIIAALLAVCMHGFWLHVELHGEMLCNFSLQDVEFQSGERGTLSVVVTCFKSKGNSLLQSNAAIYKLIWPIFRGFSFSFSFKLTSIWSKLGTTIMQAYTLFLQGTTIHQSHQKNLYSYLSTTIPGSHHEVVFE